MIKQRTTLFASATGGSYLRPFAMVTSLFLLWGFAHGLLDVLDKHFQNTLHVTKAQSGFVQFSLYIGYLLMAWPAAWVMKNFGYKRGIILGLLLFALGAFLFYPAAKLEAFIPFLLSLFVIACGLCCLETAANPYTTVLGPPAGAARRINLAQSFNGLGWILGPFIGGRLIFGADAAGQDHRFDSLVLPYMWIGSVVLAVAVIFVFTKLPVIREENQDQIPEQVSARELLRHPVFIMAVIAQFLYVAAQTGINSFFINYVTETTSDAQSRVAAVLQHLGAFGRMSNPKNPEQAASVILAFCGMGAFWIGRLSGAWFMKFVRPKKLLTIYGVINTILMLLVILKLGWLSVFALFSTYFFMSVMFPTIFALGIRNLGPLTKRASAFLVMAVAGGAFCPPLMGAIADHSGMPTAFIVPLCCFAFIAWFGFKGSGKQREDSAPMVMQYH